MSTPFPGMDPYLEDDKLWPSFQPFLVNALYQMILPGLMDRYRARVGQRHYVTEQALFTSMVREEHRESFVEIRHRSDGRLLSLLEVISPANKTTTLGRQVFLGKRQEARQQGASLVEVDLILQGKALHDYSREGLPDWDYAVTVTRSTRPEQHEIYTATLEKRLPRFRLPLASDDRDTVVDLQAAFHRAFDQGNFQAQVDYRRDPTTCLTEVQKKFIDEKLRGERLR